MVWIQLAPWPILIVAMKDKEVEKIGKNYHKNTAI